MGILPRPVVGKGREDMKGVKIIGYFPLSVLDNLETVKKLKSEGHSIDEIATLANFHNSHSKGMLASMCMGPLGPVSRLLCAQAGSVLNYGFLGSNETAPGQWSAKRLSESIRSLQPIHDESGI